LNVSDLIDVLKENENKPKPYDTTAEVVRVEDGTAWVHIPGGEDETPVSMSVSASPGETVRVRVANGHAWITGNDSAPPTDDTTAIRAQVTATTAREYAETAIADAELAHDAALEARASADEAAQAASDAQTSANAAQASATNANEYASRALGNLSTVQSVAETLTWITQHGTMTLTTDTALDPTHVYFVVDPNGDYVVGSTHYSIVAEPDADDLSTYYELSIDESLNNYVGTHLALTSEGLWLLPATSGEYKVLIATGAGSTYTDAGIYLIDSTNAIVAKFTSAGVTLGEVLKTHAEMDYHSFKLIDKESNTYFNVEDLRDANGEATVVETFTGNGSKTKFDLTYQATNTTYTVSVSDSSGLPVQKTIYDIVFTTAPTAGATITVTYKTASNQIKGLTFGTRATGVVGASSFTSGRDNIASNIFTSAIGQGAKATGPRAYAEGLYAEAKGQASHAQNLDTKASSAYQTAIGKYNVEDANGTYAFIIGNGTADNARSNAFTVDWNGNLTFGGQSATEKIGSGDFVIRFKEWTFSDCDSCTEPGWYVISASQVSDGIAHFPPTTHGGYFLCFYSSSNFSTQLFIPREQTDNFIYWRNHVSAGWGDWKLVGEMNYTPTFTAPTMATARATLLSGGYYKVGKVVYVQMAMTIASARGANTMWSYASGFPTPAGTRVALSAYVNSKGTPYTACIDNGSLNLINGNTGTAIDDVVYITGQYIEASS